jgi:hypothetical protein
MRMNECIYCAGSGIDPSFSPTEKQPCRVCFPEAAKARGVLIEELNQAEEKAIDSLARYKFQMFGYWAAIWVHLNRLSGERRKSPFASLVGQAKILRSVHEAQDAA